MTHIISTINLKGGVGKTTITAALAEILAGEHGKRVLIIDLDPQTNLTIFMIGEVRWQELNDSGQTLASLFRDAVDPGPAGGLFDIHQALQRDVSPVGSVTRVDLLASSLDLIDLQDRLLSPVGAPTAGGHSPVELLHRQIEKVADDYDYILVDCPPNLSVLTLNGLRISHGYIVPTIPDVMSTYGIPQIRARIQAFAASVGRDIPAVGLVVSKYRANVSLHRQTADYLARSGRETGLRVFSSRIPDSTEIAEAAEFNDWGTLRQRYGYHRHYDALASLATEFIAAVEDTVPSSRPSSPSPSSESSSSESRDVPS
ncbi:MULTISPECIES: ParA family protein [Protofrankia]|uniref:ParA family protein n=1 Tax=Protofrankia TaxID=2994361 RepID=UPI0002D6A995|nr:MULTISPECIES: ParA family protein [Protofrankia]